MRKWQITLMPLFLIGLVAAVFGALPGSRSTQTRKSARRYAQLDNCGANLTVKGHVGSFHDSGEPSTTLAATGVAYPHENHSIGPFVAGSRFSDYKGVFSGPWDVLTLEVVGLDDCPGPQRSPGKGLGKNRDNFVIRIAEFGSLTSSN